MTNSLADGKTQKLLNFVLLLVYALAAAGLLVRLSMILFAALPEQLEYFSDDGFYYLVLARNFNLLHAWTFDGGVSTTSGFHLLYEYILVLINKLISAPEPFVEAAACFNYACTGVFVLLLILFHARLAQPGLLLGAALLISTSSFLTASACLVEWPLVLSAALVYTFLIWLRPARVNFLLPLVGLAGALARTDFALYPACVLVAALALAVPNRRFALASLAALGLAGACLGVALTLCQSLVATGSLLQGSALMKDHWSAVLGRSPGPALSLLASALPGTLSIGSPLIQYGATVLWFALVATGCFRARRRIAGYFASWSRLPAEQDGEAVLLLASGLAIVAYVAVYSFNSGGMAVWYLANFVSPLLVLITALICPLVSTGKLYKVLVLYSMLIVMYNASVVVKLEHGPYPWHQVVLHAARQLGPVCGAGRVGAWNSGILGYFSDRSVVVVNLDGLVNNDILAYARKDQLLEYLRRHDVRFVCDWPKQMEGLSRVGGFSDGRLFRALFPRQSFDYDGDSPVFRNFTIYELQRR